MTEKAEKIYDEIESHFQEGDGALEVDMLLNLSYMLSNASDDFLDLVTWEYRNELLDDDDNNPYEPGSYYHDPEVIFKMKKNPYNIIDVNCRGFECYHRQKTLSADNSCSCCSDSIFFGCEVDEDNDAVVQRMLEYCRSNFVNISQK